MVMVMDRPKVTEQTTPISSVFHHFLLTINEVRSQILQGNLGPYADLEVIEGNYNFTTSRTSCTNRTKCVIPELPRENPWFYTKIEHLIRTSCSNTVIAYVLDTDSKPFEDYFYASFAEMCLDDEDQISDLHPNFSIEFIGDNPPLLWNCQLGLEMGSWESTQTSWNWKGFTKPDLEDHHILRAHERMNEVLHPLSKPRGLTLI
jgi:hypothetical protein